MEVEAKYQISAGDLERVAGLRGLGDYTLRAAAGERQRNTYYDSADGRLAAARYGLRVRQIGARTLVTLKGPAQIGADGVHRRSEFEFAGVDPDPTIWPAGQARDLATALLGGAPVRALLTIETDRRLLYAARDGVERAELCLDRSMIYAGGRQAPICELEVELLPGGDMGDLAALADALRAIVSIAPESQSKLARGMALLHG